MAFYQYPFFSETQADLYQSNLQGGKPLKGWVCLSDVDNSQLYKWGRWLGWDGNKPSSKQKVLSLQTFTCQKTPLKEPGRSRHPTHTDTEQLLPSCVLSASSRGQSRNCDPSGACGHPADLLCCLPQAQLTLIARPLWRQELDRTNSLALPGVFYLSQQQHLMSASENPLAHLQCHVLHFKAKIIFSVLHGEERHNSSSSFSFL